MPRAGVWHWEQHTLPGAWMDATSCTLGRAHAGLCQERPGPAPGQCWAGRGDQRGLAGLYLCREGCRPAHSRRSSTCAPQGSPDHRSSGWGRQHLSSGRASEGKTQVWLQGKLRAWRAASLAPLPTAPLQGCRPLGLSQGILSLAWGSPGHLTWLSEHAAGAAAAGAALLPRVACGVVVTSRPTARPDGTASTGAVAWALCRGECSVQPCPREQGSLQGHQHIPHPTHSPILALASLGVSSCTCGGQEAAPDLPDPAALLSTRTAVVGEAVVQPGAPRSSTRPRRALAHFGGHRQGTGAPGSLQGPVWGGSEGEGSALVPGAVLLGQGEQCQEHQKKGAVAQHRAAIHAVLLGDGLGFKPCWSQAAPLMAVLEMWACSARTIQLGGDSWGSDASSTVPFPGHW